MKQIDVCLRNKSCFYYDTPKFQTFCGSKDVHVIYYQSLSILWKERSCFHAVIYTILPNFKPFEEAKMFMLYDSITLPKFKQGSKEAVFMLYDTPKFQSLSGFKGAVFK